jgi:hypothetical protein
MQTRIYVELDLDTTSAIGESSESFVYTTWDNIA